MHNDILHRFLAAAIAAVMALSFTACHSDEPGSDGTIWDIYPIVLYFDVVDNDGASLLDTTRADNALQHNIYVEMDGKRYEMSDSLYRNYLKYQAGAPSVSPRVEGRAYLAYFHGLQLVPQYERDPDREGHVRVSSHLRLAFGEFDGADDQDLRMTIVWPEGGRRHDIHVVNRCRWKKNTPHIERHIYLDGVDINGVQEKWPITLRP